MRLLLIILLACPSCVRLRTDGVAKTTDAMFVMASARGYYGVPGGAQLAEVDATKVPLSAIRTAGTIGVSAITNGMLETVSNNSTKVSLGQQGVTKSIAAGKEATKQLKITEGTKVETFVPPPTQ